MPKRKNPYGDVTPLQLKRHVGFEERATDEEKRAMYAHTQALLFHSANPVTWGGGTNGGVASGRGQQTCVGISKLQKLIHTTPGSGWGQHLEAMPPSGGACEISPAQATLWTFFSDPAGARHSNGRRGGGGGRREGGGGGAFLPSCPSCKLVGEDEERCGHCEQLVCGSCLQLCSGCQATYCSSCSVPDYKDTELRWFCLSCLPTNC